MKIANNRQKETESSRRGIVEVVLSSAHGIVICVILLVSFSWAWFSEKVDGPSIKIRAATYGIQAEVISGNDTVTSGDYSSVTGKDNLAIEVENGRAYDIKLTGTGTTGGYCVVSAGDDIHYTEPIEAEGTLMFKIWFPGTGTSRIEFLPYWGEYPKTIPEEDMIPKEEDVLEKDRAYVVSDGDIMVSGGDRHSIREGM